MREIECCCVADQHCTAAANFEDADARATCFACGQRVCAECSSRRKYRRFGVKCICNNCQVEIDGNDHRVLDRIWRQAGYPKGAPMERKSKITPKAPWKTGSDIVIKLQCAPRATCLVKCAGLVCRAKGVALIHVSLVVRGLEIVGDGSDSGRPLVVFGKGKLATTVSFPQFAGYGVFASQIYKDYAHVTLWKTKLRRSKAERIHSGLDHVLDRALQA